MASAGAGAEYSDYIIYADESGDPNPASIDANYPVFVLNFCVFRKDEYARSVLPTVTAFKFEHFGHDDVVLHEQDIHRGKAPFDFGQDSQRKKSFRDELNDRVAGFDFGVIATVIEKSRLSQQVVSEPYELALRLCMEQAHAFLESHGQGASITHIILEGRGRKEDADLLRVFQRIADGYNDLGKVMPGFELVFANKSSNSTGLQIADYTAYSIGRNYVSPARPNLVWETLVKPKMFKGIKVFPDSA